MEVWKSIPGFSKHEASSHGRIRSVGGRVLKTRYDRGGYLRLNLKSRQRGHSTIRVHRLVCEAFHGPPPEGMEVLHADHDKTNNHASNLSWGTRAENIGKLTEPCIHIILAMLAAKHRAVDVAKRFGISKRYVYKLKHGEKWAHLPRPHTLQ